MDQALLEEMKVKHGSSNTECLHSISSQPEELGIHNVFPGLPSTGDGLVLKQSRLRPLSPAGGDNPARCAPRRPECSPGGSATVAPDIRHWDVAAIAFVTPACFTPPGGIWVCSPSVTESSSPPQV